MWKKGEKDEKRSKMARTAQTGLWVALILVQMAVVNCLTVRAEDGAERATEIMENGAERASEIMENGAGETEGFKLRQIEKDVVYEGVEGGTPLPDTLDIQVEEDGQTVTAVCSLQERTVLRERWDDSFSFPITFHTYDAEYYRLGDRLVPYNAERPELKGCEGQLLGLIGVTPEEYQFTTLEWSGEPYLAEGGELCRDAVGSGRKLVRDYRVRYAGTAEIPVRQKVQPEAVTETEETARETSVSETVGPAAPKVTVRQETAAPGTEQEGGRSLGLLQKITRTLLIIIGIGVILFFVGLAALAFLWVVKKLRRWYTGRK